MADVKWTGPIYGTDPYGRQITAYRCDNWVNADKNSCFTSPTKPNIIKWQVCPIGSPIGSGLCGSFSSGPTDFNCVWGQDCYGITRVIEPPRPTNSTTFNPSRSFCDGKTSTEFRMCTNWANNDPNSCNNVNVRPSNVVAWQTCGIGSSPGGAEPGHSAQACSRPSTNFNCVWGQNCFAITKKTPNATNCDSTTFSPTFQACDGNDLIKFQSCDNWANLDPNSCATSSKRPANIIDWKRCALGSSPGGVVLGKGGAACPIPATTNFSCLGGQECFAVIQRTKEEPSCVQSNPINIIKSPFSFLSNLGSWASILFFVCIGLSCLCLIGLLLSLFSKSSPTTTVPLSTTTTLPSLTPSSFIGGPSRI
jgi:hypothetical protein